MPRSARASGGGYCYHVINRGNAKAEVFHKDENFGAFVRIMGESRIRVPMRVVAYCLMPNHFRLVLWPHADGDLSRWMHWGERWQFVFALHAGWVSAGECRSSAPRPSTIRAISTFGIAGRS